MAKRKRRKIPRNAVESLMQTCEMLSGEWKKPAAEIFKDFLGMMNKYADYFFKDPWPEKYNYEEATTFSDEDTDFLFESAGDFADRYTTVCLKKNMNLEKGFIGYFGMFWTEQAFHERFERPEYKPVLEAFEEQMRRDENAESVLKKLREQFSARLIHDSLIDLVGHEYPDEPRRRLIGTMFELLHTHETMPSCGDFRCSWYRKSIDR